MSIKPRMPKVKVSSVARDAIELEDEAYDAFRELEASLTKNPPGKATKLVRRKKKYVSPRRREIPAPREVECSECSLPSAKNLPPLVRVSRMIDGEKVAILRHALCPSDPKEIKKMVIAQREFRKARWEEYRTGGNKVYSVHNGVRILVA